MIRTSLLSLALLVLIGALASHAEESKDKQATLADQKGFRVYTFRARCGNRDLQGVYASIREALRAADELREKGSRRVEVTTGSEGKEMPAREKLPAVYLVYSKICDKGGWQRQEVASDLKTAEAIALTHKKNREEVQIVSDYAPKEVFHIYSSTGWRLPHLLGTYLSVSEAVDAAERFRTQKKLECEVTTGTKGGEILTGSPTQYSVYSLGCRSGWVVAATTKDKKKALEVAEEQRKDDRKVEVVYHYSSK
jgi:hypothetical protein